MKLAERKEKILAAVVERFLQSGDPIGSKTIMSDELGVSSATIRNELASLDELGFLTQPHTSAGRVPTKAGYRYYIDNLMKPEELSERVKAHIERAINSSAHAPEAVLKKTAQVLSELSGVAAVATTPPSTGARVHRIRFVSTGRYTSMAVLVTSNGMVKSRLFRCEFVLTPELLGVFDKALNEKFAGVELKDINQGFLQMVASSMGELTFFMPDVLIALYEAVQAAKQTTVTVSGGMNLLYFDGYDFINARNALRFLSDEKSISGLMNNTRDKKIFLGDESRIPELSGSAVIASRYEIGGENAGAVAVVGPLRIDYRTLLSEVVFAAGCVSEAIGNIVEK